MKAIEMTGVRKAFRFFTLEDVSLALEPGQIMGLVGPNGAGKSTTIRLLMGLLSPDAGSIRLLGHDMPRDQAAAKADVGFVSDDMKLLPQATLAWHMDFVASVYPGWDTAYAATLLKRFGLHAGQTAKSLSSGEQAKALLLLALARRPRLLVLDEPTAGMDPVARQELMTEFMDVLRDESKHVALLARTVTQDAGRMAQQSGMAAETAVRGYVRKVHLPACPRCIILSGRFYRYSDGFLRHPNCDCTMIPVAVGLDMVHAEDPAELMARMQAEHPERLRKSLTEGDLKALEHGADLNQVVNAHRGMTTAAGPGRTGKVTTEGTTKRGFAGQRLAAEGFVKSGGRYQRARTPRLTPAQIFTEADINGWDRTEIVRQLKRFGFVI